MFAVMRGAVSPMRGCSVSTTANSHLQLRFASLAPINWRHNLCCKVEFCAAILGCSLYWCSVCAVACCMLGGIDLHAFACCIALKQALRIWRRAKGLRFLCNYVLCLQHSSLQLLIPLAATLLTSVLQFDVGALGTFLCSCRCSFFAVVSRLHLLRSLVAWLY